MHEMCYAPSLLSLQLAIVTQKKRETDAQFFLLSMYSFHTRLCVPVYGIGDNFKRPLARLKVEVNLSRIVQGY